MAVDSVGTVELPIARIQPTQDNVRRPERLHHLARALEHGYDFTQEDPIQLTQFEDHTLYCHNGHHRIAAKVMAGQTVLLPGEYRIEQWRYDQYLEINWTAGYITPFHPPTESRLGQLRRFREIATFVRERVGAKTAESFIWRNPALYKKPRTIISFVELTALVFDPVQWALAETRVDETLTALTDKEGDQ